MNKDKLVLFAGASNGKKVVSFYHGDHLKYPPPVIGEWTEHAKNWLTHSPIGQWIMDGEKISNLKHQWVFVDVREI
jgi:hypothetical protein